MPRRLLAFVLLALFAFAAIPSALADEFQLPGLESDADAWAGTLQKRFPAGGTTQARRAAEQAAAAALQKKDFAAAVTALEQRIALGEPTGKQFQDIADASMHRIPPDPAKALLAAWKAFARADAGAAEIPPLLVMADALRGLERNAQAVQALEAVIERAPDNAAYKRLLADAQRATGLQVRRVTPEGDTDPPRACIDFTVAPVRRSDFNAADWVRLDPPLPNVAVTREGDQICFSGLTSGTTTRIVLRAGLPGEQGLALTKETVLSVALPNRQPRIAFDTRLFVLPRGQAPAVNLSTVNLSSVALKLLRLTERNIPALLRDTKLGDPVDTWTANSIAENTGRVVWEGSAEIPKWEPNRTARTALPLPEALRTAGPGLYALVASPGDGTRESGAGAVQMVLRTDLAPTVWRGSVGLTVQVRAYSDAKPRPGVRLDLLARNNDILGQATTDDNGVARFAAPLLRGEGPLAPAVLQAFGAGDDFAALDLTTAAFDLSDRGVEGMPQPGPLDSYVYLDRGIYRPGETVRVMALLRDAAGQPVDVPAQLTVKRPNGQVFLQATPARQAADGSLYLPVVLSPGAPAGTWTIEVRADPKAPPIGRTEFRVDAFLPDRMAVEAGPAPAALIPGQSTVLPVTARFLYGAPAANLSGKATLRLVVDPEPFPALAGYRIGLADETYAPESRDLDLPDTDAQGQTRLTLLLSRAPDTTQALKAAIEVTVNDPSGHGSRAALEIPVRPAFPLIGIKPGFADDAIDADADAAFDIAAVRPDGQRTALKGRLRLVRERPDWRLVMRGSLARYETVWRDEPLETRAVDIPAGAPLRFAKKLDFGRYRLEVAEQGGMAATSYRFRAGWASTDSPDVPDRVDVSADRRSVPAGQAVKIHIAPPFAGQATVLVLTDRVVSVRDLAVPAGGTDIEVPVEAAWGPGAYVAVHVFRPGGDGTRPGRAIGLTWVGVDPAARTLAVVVAAPERLPPRTRSVVPVRTVPGAWVTLAAVDEGILRLTRFASPDPVSHFLGRRSLGIDIRDDWGRLIAPPDGEAALLRQGGDEASFALPDIPLRTVTLFTPPVQAGADGVAQVPLDMPDFNGQVRLMAVSWQGSRIGAGSADVIVRDPLVAEALLPRFLAPGDEARLAVLLHNVDLPGGEAVAHITVQGPLQVAGSDRLAVNLAAGAQSVPATVLRATGAGRGLIRLEASGPGGFSVVHDYAITVRPARGPASVLAGAELAPGGEVALAPTFARFLAGTAHASATFGAPVRYDTAGLVEALADYPLSCLEQATSRGFPLALLPDGPLAGEDRAGRLQAAVTSVLDRQRYDGAFALWTASGEAQPWLTPYAMEFLLRARAAGAVVPDAAIADAMKALGEAAEESGTEPPDMAAQAYRLYVLALGGQGRPGAARVLAEQIDKLPTPLAKAQLGAALALSHDSPRAEAAFAAALASPARRWWGFDYGTALRDRAAITVLLKESGLLPQRLLAFAGGLPGADLNPDTLSTQEQAWAAAAAAVLGRDGRPAHIALDGRNLPSAPLITVALDGAATARNLGDRPIWQALSVTGIPAQALPASRNQMRVQRRFFNLDGSTLDLDKLKQNTVFVLLIEGRAEDAQEHRGLVMQGLPAGWEIAGRFAEGEVPGMKWLGDLSDTETQISADDRFAAVVALTEDKPAFRIAVRLRAVTPGNFEIPGAELADMYRPTIYARQAANRMSVLAPE